MRQLSFSVLWDGYASDAVTPNVKSCKHCAESLAHDCRELVRKLNEASDHGAFNCRPDWGVSDTIENLSAIADYLEGRE